MLCIAGGGGGRDRINDWGSSTGNGALLRCSDGVFRGCNAGCSQQHGQRSKQHVEEVAVTAVAVATTATFGCCCRHDDGGESCGWLWRWQEQFRSDRL